MGHSDLGIGAWSVLVYIFLYLPIVVLIVFSFNNQKLNVTGRLHARWYTAF